MKMHMRINHHQHQVIHLFGSDKTGKCGFDIPGDACQLLEGRIRKGAEGFMRAVGQQNQRAKRDLFRSRQDAPVLIIGDQRVGATKFRECHISGNFHVGCL